MPGEKILEKAAHIRLAVFDVDGVMTNGELILGNDGNEFKIFHVHDGLGLVMLKSAGFNIAVISARSSEVVSERMAALGIEYIYQGQNSKSKTIITLMNELNIDKRQTAYAGDDLIDLPAMAAAGLAIAVANAHPHVKKNADWITEKPGGQGAVREICELLLQAQGKLDMCYQNYLAGADMKPGRSSL